MLALAGISRLNFRVTPEGRLEGEAVPDGLLAAILETEVMLPCVGQGAVGIEMRQEDERIAAICERLNHFDDPAMRHRRTRLPGGDGRRLRSGRTPHLLLSIGRRMARPCRHSKSRRSGQPIRRA